MTRGSSRPGGVGLSRDKKECETGQAQKLQCHPAEQREDGKIAAQGEGEGERTMRKKTRGKREMRIVFQKGWEGERREGEGHW